MNWSDCWNEMAFPCFEKKAPFATMQNQGMTRWFELIIMARRKFRQALVMLFLKPQE